MSIPRLSGNEDLKRPQERNIFNRSIPRDANASSKSTFVRDDRSQQKRLIAQGNPPSGQQDDIEFQTTFWRDVEWKGLSIRIYKDYRPNAEHKYYVFPSLRLVGLRGSSLARVVRQSDVHLTFEFLPSELRERLLKEIIRYSGNVAKERINIGIIPINSIEIKSTSGCRWGMGLNKSPSNSLVVLQPGDRRLRFRCSNENAANNFVKYVNNGEEDFRVKIGARGKDVSRVSVEISTNQITEKDFENDMNPGKNLDNPKQYFSARQVASVVENALSNHRIVVREEGNVRGKYILPTEFQGLLRKFLHHAFKRVPIDLSEQTRFYVGKKNIDPDVIKSESRRVTRSFNQFAQKLFGDLKRLAKSGSRSEFNRDVNDAFQRNFSSQFSSQSSKAAQGATQFNMTDGFERATAMESHTQQQSLTTDQVNKLFTDVTRAGAESFGRDALDIIKRYTTDTLNKQSNTEWSFQGEIITPRKIWVYRLVRARLKTNRVLSYAHETIISARQPITFERNSSQDVVIKGKDEFGSKSIGTIVPFDGTHPPSGWKKCDGSEITVAESHILVQKARESGSDLKLSDAPEGMKIVTLPNRPGFIIKTGSVE